MKSATAINHILGVTICSAIVFLVMFGAFFLSMTTFHNGPASDYSFSKSEVFAADAGEAVSRVLMWPGHRVTSSLGAWFGSSVAYGIALYGLFILFRRRRPAA